jgi:hypothetical protein
MGSICPPKPSQIVSVAVDDHQLSRVQIWRSELQQVLQVAHLISSIPRQIKSPADDDGAKSKW